jgi:hypothetical protein
MPTKITRGIESQRKFANLLPMLRAAAAGRGYLLAVAVGEINTLVAIPRNDDALENTGSDVAFALATSVQATKRDMQLRPEPERFGRSRWTIYVAPDLTLTLIILATL